MAASQHASPSPLSNRFIKVPISKMFLTQLSKMPCAPASLAASPSSGDHTTCGPASSSCTSSNGARSCFAMLSALICKKQIDHAEDIWNNYVFVSDKTNE